MTNNNPITADNLSHGDLVKDATGALHIIGNIRMIDHKRVRITTLEGLVRVASNDELFELQ